MKIKWLKIKKLLKDWGPVVIAVIVLFFIWHFFNPLG